MPEGSPKLRDNIAIPPLLLAVAVLGFVAFGVSELTSGNTPSNALLAQVAETSDSIALDSSCTALFDYSCEAPGFNEITGKPCGLGLKVGSDQVIGHCIAQGKAQAECFLNGSGQCEPLQQASASGYTTHLSNDTASDISPEGEKVTLGSIYDVGAQTPASLISSEFSALPTEPGSLEDQTGYNSIEDAANAARFTPGSLGNDAGEYQSPEVGFLTQTQPTPDTSQTYNTLAQNDSGGSSQPFYSDYRASTNVEDDRPEYNTQSTFQSAQSSPNVGTSVTSWTSNVVSWLQKLF